MQESKWYRELVAMHGRERVSVGAVAFSPDEACWVSSTVEDEPMHEEHDGLVHELTQLLRDYRKTRLPNAKAIQGPSVLGDFFGFRIEKLLFDLEIFVDLTSGLVEVLEIVQRCLQRPPNARWRIEYLDPDCSIVVYANTLFIGNNQYSVAQDGVRELGQWLRERAAN